MKHKYSRWFGLALIGAVLITVVAGVTGTSITQAQAGGTLGYGSKVYGSISAAAPLVTYSFSGSPGDFVAITADTWTGTLDIQLDLVAPNGLILDHRTQNTPNGDPMGVYLSVFLPEAGVYLLRLSGENGTTGDFLLMLLGRSTATATPLNYGQAVDVTIAPNAAPQFFSFETQNCPTTLVVSNPGQGQPLTFPFVAKVRDQRGQMVALLRGGVQTEDWVTVQPKSGRYEVEVLAADPSLGGSIRLLVTCSGDNPGCPAGQGAPGTEGCPSCPRPGDMVRDGGCPDLHLVAALDVTAAGNAVKVVWDPVPGVDGYTVRVTGIQSDGSETYLTHADWIPGDPTSFTWVLPVEGYTAFQFTLEVLVGGSVLCSQQTLVEAVPTDANCPDLGLSGVVTDPSVHAVTLSWAAGLGADQFDLDLYAISPAGEEFGGRLVLPGDATGRAFDHFPPEFTGVRFVLWMWSGGRLCSAETTILFEQQQDTCPNLGLAITGYDPATRTVTLSWAAVEGTDYEIMVYGTTPGGTKLALDALRQYLPAGTTTTTITLPDGYAEFSFWLDIDLEPLDCYAEVVMAQQQTPDCTNFAISTTYVSAGQVDIAWPAFPGADGYVYQLMDDARNLIPGHSVILGPAQLSISLLSPPIAPGSYIVSIAPWDDETGAFCPQEAAIKFGGAQLPCAIRADREGVNIRVGPGPDRAVFAWLFPGIDYTVVSQATGSDGSLWWEIDRSQVPGGGEATSLWVAQGDVTTVGDCTQVPTGDVPPVIPEEEEPPPGTWGPCGSCSTCGHPANECVTSPEGLCLWDPATCQEQPPPGGGEGCIVVQVAVDRGQCFESVSASLLTPSNCEGGGFSPGTTVQASATEVGKCRLLSWSGCGAGGSANPTSFTPGGSCTVTAHMGY